MRSYNIVYLGGERNKTSQYYGINLERSFNRLGDHRVSKIKYKEIYQQYGPVVAAKLISDELSKNNAEIVLICQDCDYEFPIEFFFGLRSRYFLIMQVGDDEQIFDKCTRYYSQAFDLVWTASSKSVARYKLYNVDAVSTPPAFDLRSVKNFSCEKIHDLCFVGSVQRKIGRKEYLNHLLKNGINIKIFGAGTSAGTVSRNEMNRIYASSKIGLSFTGISPTIPGRGLDGDITINQKIKQIKGRAHEIALTGTFVLSEYAPGIEDHFKFGDEIDVFHCKDELLSKVKYYLGNEIVRERMALKAYERAILICDEVRVCKKLMDTIDAKIIRKNEPFITTNNIIYKDPIFNRAYSSFHLFKTFEFILKGKPRIALNELSIYLKHPLFDAGVFRFYVRRVFVGIKWLFILVQKLKNITEAKHGDKI